MPLDPDACYRALVAHDARFDGLFFTAVSTTGIYCRPVCRAKTPGRDRCTFYRHAAAAEHDGYRACFRCRPELAPGAAPVDARSRLVAAAARRIEAGALDSEGTEELARSLDVSSRHLRRVLVAEFGVGPLELVQSRRLALAKQLIRGSRMPLTEVAFASGFASVRRFNALFRAREGLTPSAVRRAGRKHVDGGTIALTLETRPPYDWGATLKFLAPRAIPGVEAVRDETYLRTIALGEHAGWLTLAPERTGERLRLRATLATSLAPVLPELVARLRRAFDLDAEPATVNAHLARDPTLAPLVRARPGLRVTGGLDPFEVAVRAVLGQQVSVAGATTLAGRVAARFGQKCVTPHPELVRIGPAAGRLARASEEDIASVGLTRARAACLRALAVAVVEKTVRLDAHDPEAVAAELEAVRGVGPWTASYIALRALAWPDAFPAGDLGLRRALADISIREVTSRAEAWRPWRAYAAMHLWASLGAGKRAIDGDEP